MSFEPHNICPTLIAARAARLLKRHAAGDALIARLAPRMLELADGGETKGITGAAGRDGAPHVSGAVVRSCAVQPAPTSDTLADVAATGGAGIRQDAGRCGMGS